MAITISTLNLAARNMMRITSLSSKTSKSFISYTAVKRRAHESDYYKANVLNNQAFEEETVSSVAGASIENSTMSFVSNHDNALSHPAEDADHTFVPSVSSPNGVSGIGHSQV